jgi:hypothetical protein
MGDGTLLIDYGDGVSALDRSMRSITMATDGAIQRLVSLGWERSKIDIELDGIDPIPFWITVSGTRAYHVDLTIHDEGRRIVIVGEWLEGFPIAPPTELSAPSIREPGFIDRILGRRAEGRKP